MLNSSVENLKFEISRKLALKFGIKPHEAYIDEFFRLARHAMISKEEHLKAIENIEKFHLHKCKTHGLLIAYCYDCLKGPNHKKNNRLRTC